MNMYEELFISRKQNFLPVYEPDLVQKELKEAVEGTTDWRERRDAIDDLIGLYCARGHFDKAINFLSSCIKKYAKKSNHLKAYWIFRKGQISERRLLFTQARKYYQKSLELKPKMAWLRYFLHNNIGFCLLFKKQFKSAEVFCREAVEINPEVHNAWKNLGVSLEHQGKYLDAAKCYLQSINVYPGDDRVRAHLQRLLDRIPNIKIIPRNGSYEDPEVVDMSKKTVKARAKNPSKGRIERFIDNGQDTNQPRKEMEDK